MCSYFDRILAIQMSRECMKMKTMVAEIIAVRLTYIKKSGDFSNRSPKRMGLKEMMIAHEKKVNAEIVLLTVIRFSMNANNNGYVLEAPKPIKKMAQMNFQDFSWT